MSAKIFQLGDYRRGSVRCQPLDFSFPILYRHTGFNWMAGAGDLVPDLSNPWLDYTLSRDPGTAIIHDEAWTEIDRLDPALDRGWVTIRHHANHDRARGYLAHHLDTGPLRGGQMLFQTRVGLFSIVAGQAREGCQDNLLIYVASVPGDLGEEEWTCVIASDGAPLDESSLYPPDYIDRG